MVVVNSVPINEADFDKYICMINTSQLQTTQEAQLPNKPSCWLWWIITMPMSLHFTVFLHLALLNILYSYELRALT